MPNGLVSAFTTGEAVSAAANVAPMAIANGFLNDFSDMKCFSVKFMVTPFGGCDRVYNDYLLNDNRYQMKFRKSIILNKFSQAGHIGSFIGHRVIALCLPDGFGKAVHHAVLSLVRRTEGFCELLMAIPDA